MKREKIDNLMVYIEDKNGNSPEYRQLKKFMSQNGIDFTYDKEIKAFHVEKDSISKLSAYNCIDLFELHLFYVDDDKFLQIYQVCGDDLPTLVE